MSDFQRQLLYVSLVVIGASIFLTWSITTIRYHITATRLKVTWLGLPVRWIRLDSIKHIGIRPVFWAERWPNVLSDKGRILAIRRRAGLFKTLLITPKHPFQFKASLEQARGNVLHGPRAQSNEKPSSPKPESGSTRSNHETAI